MMLACCLLLASCFGSGIEKRGAVYGFENGRVKTVGGHFHVGLLPEIWKFRKIRARAILFRNADDESTITVSSWCRGAVDDEPQRDLSKKVLQVVSEAKVLSLAEDVPLHAGVASQTVVEGVMESQSVLVKSAVIKRQGCVFDFLYVTHPKKRQYEDDFDHMIRGFRYGSGPDFL